MEPQTWPAASRTVRLGTQHGYISFPGQRDREHSTGQSSIVKCNLSSTSLLVHHKTPKDLSVVSKLEPLQEVKMKMSVNPRRNP